MILHHFKLAWRNLLRNKTFSVINIFGLTVGLASCILIGLYVLNELSFDQFHTNHQQIYRVNKNTNEKDKQAQRDGITPGQLVPSLIKELPEIVHAARYRPWFTEMLVSNDSIRLILIDVAYADAGFLEMFDFSLINGDRKTALAEPFTAVITESTAQKYFGKNNPMGKILKSLNDIPVRITGVARDVPDQSSMHFTMLISWTTTTAPANADYFSWMNNWITQVNYSFVQLKKNTDPSGTSKKISAILHKNLPERQFEYKPYLQPLNEIHLGSGDVLYAEHFRSNSSKVIYALLIIAGFILLIACFNFINLTTAGALSRAKETGVQKVLGARQGQLIWKSFGESFLLCLASLCLAIVMACALLPLFNKLANSRISVHSLFQYQAILAIGLLLLVISITAGLYPAVFLSKFKSTDVFRNVIKAGKDSWIRKALVTTQFALSILLIIATLTVQKQTHYLMTRDLGFDKEQVLVMQLANTSLENKSKKFVIALQQHPSIAAISVTNRVPGHTFNGYGIIPEGHNLDEHLMANVLETDTRFADAYNIKMAKGRYFSQDMPTDTTEAIVINEAMARYLNWNDPIGKQFEVYGERKGRVIGMIRDFNSASLRENIQPLAIILKSNPMYLSVKFKNGDIQAALDHFSKTWRKFEPEHPFDYTFLEEQLNQFYQRDVRLLRVLGIFAALAISIACMGLFGLSIYAARQRTKEIGIRKVLGASVSKLVSMLSKDFLKLVGIAAIIAFPVAWWATSKWLEDFAYRIPMTVWIFFIAGGAAILVALAAISFNTIKVAIANPVKSLRTE